MRFGIREHTCGDGRRVTVRIFDENTTRYAAMVNLYAVIGRANNGIMAKVAGPRRVRVLNPPGRATGGRPPTWVELGAFEEFLTHLNSPACCAEGRHLLATLRGDAAPVPAPRQATAQSEYPAAPAADVEHFGEYPLRFFDWCGLRWFNPSDACAAIGVADANSLLTRLDADEKGLFLTQTPGGNQLITWVNEFGIVSLILGARRSSDRPRVREYQRWVSHEVIPSLRRSGRYEMPAGAADPQAPADPRLAQVEMLGRMVAQLTRQLEGQIALEAEQAAQRAEIGELKARQSQVEETLNGEHNYYALAPWAKHKLGAYLDKREAKAEAIKYLVPWSKERGIHYGKAKSEDFTYVNTYREDLLWEWAEHYRRRNPGRCRVANGVDGRKSAQALLPYDL